MRLCIFSSHHLDLVGLGKEALLTKVSSSLKPNDVEQVYLTSYRVGMDSPNLRLLSGHESLRLTLCRRLFRLIDSSPWIPPALAYLFLRYCEKQIAEVILACDPDVIAFLDIRWDKQLVFTLRKQFPHWRYLPELDRPADLDRKCWRIYDSTPKVSIVLPTYNGTRYIRRSIESCLRQTFTNIELLIVDDGSSQDIEQIVRGYSDQRIKYFRHTTNLGLPEALNTGFNNSTGEYLTWTSDDNYYADDAIEQMLCFLQTYPQVDFVYADNYIVDENDHVRTVQTNKASESLVEDNYIGACFLYKREVYQEIGDYSPKAILAEDYEYWVRISKRFLMQRLFRVLYYYRVHSGSLTSKYSRSEVQEKVAEVKRSANIASSQF